MAPDIHIPDGKDAVKVVSDFARTAPHWVALILVVGAFLWYLERHDQVYREMLVAKDTVAVQRIAQFHVVQNRGWESMDRLSETLDAQTTTFSKLATAIDRHNGLVH